MNNYNTFYKNSIKLCSDYKHNLNKPHIMHLIHMASNRSRKTRRTARRTARKTARKTVRKTVRKTRIIKKAKKPVKRRKKAITSKIADLEKKLKDLSKEKPKPAEITPPPPPPKPAEITPPPPPPKPAEKAPPVLVYEQWKQVPTKNWNDQKAVLTGYTASSDRYWASLHVQNAPDVPAANWNDQKAVLTGYTHPGNKYFATRQRLANHPRDKTFQPGIAVSAGSGGSTQTSPPPPPPKQSQPESQPQSSSGKKSKQQELEDYEKEYIVRYAQEQEEATKAVAEEASAASKRGAMPKGF